MVEQKTHFRLRAANVGEVLANAALRVACGIFKNFDDTTQWQDGVSCRRCESTKVYRRIE